MSNKLPWMPLDIPAYRNDTSHLTTLQHGAYMLLLMHYWSHGPLPDDDEQLAAIAKMDCKTWKANRKVIRQFFSEHNGELHQKRADAEREKAADVSAKRRDAANARYRPPPNGPANAGAKAPPNEHAEAPSDADPHASHTVPSTEERKEVINKPSFSSTMRARPEPAGDALNALLADAGIEKPERIDRSNDEPASTDPVILATIRKATKACTMRVPYGEVRSVEAQLAALEPQPAAVGAEMTMGLRWQPAAPVRSPAEQLAALLSISLAEAEARIPADAA